MKYLYLIPLGLLALTVSCKSTKTATTNPYQSNPYYGPSSTYKKATTDYSTTPSTVNYPTYSESTYTPPAAPTTSVPSVPSVPTYSSSAGTNQSYMGPSSSVGSSSSHTVASGENLYRISQRNGTTVAAIKSANGLTSDTIRPGQVLRIP